MPCPGAPRHRRVAAGGHPGSSAVGGILSPQQPLVRLPVVGVEESSGGSLDTVECPEPHRTHGDLETTAGPAGAVADELASHVGGRDDHDAGPRNKPAAGHYRELPV